MICYLTGASVDENHPIWDIHLSWQKNTYLNSEIGNFSVKPLPDVVSC